MEISFDIFLVLKSIEYASLFANETILLCKHKKKITKCVKPITRINNWNHAYHIAFVACKKRASDDDAILHLKEA